MLREILARRTAVLLAVCGGVSSAAAQPLVTLFIEDFDTFPLTVNQEEGVFTGTTGQCATAAFLGDGSQCGAANANANCAGVPPFIDCSDFVNVPFDGMWSYRGWDQTFGARVLVETTLALPGIGCAEWQGWSVADYNFWINADTQLRETFAKASGNVMVADPDEWDDFDPASLDPDQTGVFSTELFAPWISLAGVTPNTVVLNFDSSWRPEANDDGPLFNSQTAIVEVEFLDAFNVSMGTVEVLRWTSDPIDSTFHPDAANESIALFIPNPVGAANMRINFVLGDAQNDWWWAIDNIEVAGQGGTPVLPPSAFDLVAPAFNFDTTPTIEWTPSVNATTYDVIWASDAAFTDVVISTSTGASASNQTYTPAAGVLQGGVYYVKVVARNTLGVFERTATIAVDNPCPADITGNGSLSTADVTAFMAIFNNGCP